MIKRRGKFPVALIDADELSPLLESFRLLRSSAGKARGISMLSIKEGF